MKFIFMCLLFLVCGDFLQAEEYVVSIQKKQEDKYKNRWTLADYFDTQKKIRMQDMWLAAHTRNDPFEFYLGYESAVISDDPKTFSERTEIGHLGAFANFAGLDGQWVNEKSLGKGWNATLLLRLLGDSVQNTNLTLGYGQAYREISNLKFQNPFYHVSVSLYFSKYFGVDYLYRQIQSFEDQGTVLSGVETEITLFIDYSFLRPYITMKNMERTLKTTVETKSQYQGYSIGLKLFL